MIKVGIIGCGNLRAAELVRILINHPDVELKWVCDGGCRGMRLDQVVPGIVGESDLVVSARGECADEVSVVFMCDRRAVVTAQLQGIVLSDDLHVIDLSGSHNLDHGPDKPWAYGMSEMQRRMLVHDTRLVTVPGSAAAVALLALMPLARNLMLNNPLKLHVALGTSALLSSSETMDGMSLEEWTHDQQQEIMLALRQCQSSFDQPMSLTVTPLAERRTLAVAVRMKCGVDEEAIRQLYEEYYDDHHFVFMVDRRIVTADVENTNKCLIRLEKDDRSAELTIHAVTDVLLKGAAGNAVHAMNLLFGLHERAGLTLKGTGC